ncbi:hypothetical protein EV127DRAFT_344895 [Xylaria flabelliformis]|nr:hypothetical protein EV127DRAFT_344895 [Xylaria flabelliformis]
MDLKSATTRLRRTFAYPSDTTTTSPSSSRYQSDDDLDTDGPALDEQEQEELIQSLVHQNAKRNAQFRIFLLCLPALSTIPYFLVLFGGVADIWIALLALSSLASTAWTLWSLPPGVTGIRVLDAWVGSSKDDDGTSTTITLGGGGGGLGPMGANARRRRRASAGSHSFFWSQHHRSPLQQYLPFLNVALCSLLILAGFLSSSQRSAAHQHWGHVGLANLPALIYVVVLVAKMLMGSIDPERELSALRYEYKGA